MKLRLVLLRHGCDETSLCGHAAPTSAGPRAQLVALPSPRPASWLLWQFGCSPCCAGVPTGGPVIRVQSVPCPGLAAFAHLRHGASGELSARGAQPGGGCPGVPQEPHGKEEDGAGWRDGIPGGPKHNACTVRGGTLIWGPLPTSTSCSGHFEQVRTWGGVSILGDGSHPIPLPALAPALCIRHSRNCPLAPELFQLASRFCQKSGSPPACRNSSRPSPAFPGMQGGIPQSPPPSFPPLEAQQLGRAGPEGGTPL